MTELCEKTAVELRRLVGRKDVAPVEIVDSCIERVEAVDGALNAVVTRAFDRAREEAAAAEKAAAGGEALGLLHGLPVGVKDLEATAGIRTTLGSQLHKDDVPDADQASIANIRDEGGIVLGKTNTPEFGAGANTRNLVFGATGNPFDPAKTCGGSSGGSAVALATGMVPLATGSDYGGSLRTPAGFCGVVGFRPSPGVVPYEGRQAGLLPFSVLGPMARTVEDAHLLLQAQMGFHPHDAFASFPDGELFAPLQGADLSEMKVLLSADLDGAPMSGAYRSVFKGRCGLFRHHFAEAEDGDPDFADADNSFEVLRGVNFVAAHGERVRGSRKKLSPNVVDNVDRGLEYSLGDVAEAHLQQTRIARAWLDLFDRYDVVVCPATAVSPFDHEQWSGTEIDGAAMDTYMRWLAITYRPTMALACSAVLPCGLDDQGMPFGIQVLGPPGGDRLVLEVARSLEEVLEGHAETRRPVPDIAALAG